MRRAALVVVVRFEKATSTWARNHALAERRERDALAARLDGWRAAGGKGDPTTPDRGGDDGR